MTFIDGEEKRPLISFRALFRLIELPHVCFGQCLLSKGIRTLFLFVLSSLVEKSTLRGECVKLEYVFVYDRKDNPPTVNAVRVCTFGFFFHSLSSFVFYFNDLVQCSSLYEL